MQLPRQFHARPSSERVEKGLGSGLRNFHLDFGFSVRKKKYKIDFNVYTISYTAFTLSENSLTFFVRYTAMIIASTNSRRIKHEVTCIGTTFYTL